ncbi:MAG: hypothetical protein RLZZ612_322 [Pseudomonadota bacterium]|jgi:uncharacterized protein (DUF4415 family)
MVFDGSDGREDDGEDRWATIGLAYSTVLYVVYTVRNEETIRLISAREANANERIQYREANTWSEKTALLHSKQQITLRIDAEVLDFFRHTGKRYQSRMNAVLRAYMEAHKTPEAGK